jgi:hypothetical protein
MYSIILCIPYGVYTVKAKVIPFTVLIFFYIYNVTRYIYIYIYKSRVYTSPFIMRKYRPTVLVFYLVYYVEFAEVLIVVIEDY